MPASPRIATAITAAALLLAPALHAQTVMKPGGWQMESRVTARSADGDTKDVGSQRMAVCLTAEALAREPYFNAEVDKNKAAARGATCTTSDHQRQGNAASWTMRCTLADGTSTRARISNQASADRLDLEMVQEVERDGQRATVTIRGTARHAGECTPEMMKP